MSKINSTILTDLGWEKGLVMPAANDENKRLEKKIRNKLASVSSAQNELADAEDTVNALVSHLKNMRQELQNTQGLTAARGKEVESELHLQKLTLREKGHLKQQVTRLMKEMDDLNTQRNTLESNISLQTGKLKQLQSKLNWDQRSLESWLEENAKKDEDAMTIQKYSRQDDVKIKELSFSVEKLIAVTLQKKHALDIEVMNTLASQIELDKTAQNFRSAHVDRGQLLLQWENTIELMKKRDREMDKLAEKLTKAKMEVRRRNLIMCNKLAFLKGCHESNIETEKLISAAERKNIVLKDQLSEAEQQRREFEHETEMLQRTLEQSSLDLELCRSAIVQVKMECAEKKSKLYFAKDVRRTLEDKLKTTVEATLKIGSEATAIDDMFMKEENKQKFALLELKHLETMHCKMMQDYNVTQVEYRILNATLNCSYNTIKNLASKTVRLDNQTLKQQEILYAQNLHILQLEKRCHHMEGENNSEDKTVLEEKSKELQKGLDYQNQTHSLLVNHLRKLKENQIQAQIEVNKSMASKEDLLVKIADFNLLNVGFGAELRDLIKKKQNLMVDENLLKLEMKKMRDLLNCHADGILSLEVRKLQMDSALKERHQEIKIHQEMLRVKMNVEEEQRKQATAELFEKISKIDRLKMRFEYIIVSLSPPNDGDGETSMVYFLIKVAAEKEALQREGNQLDLNIRKAEKDIQALGNTLTLLNGGNNLYQQSFQKLTETSDEINRKHAAEENMKAVIDKYKYKKRQIKELEEELHTRTATLNALTRDEEAISIIVTTKKERVAQLQNEAKEQREKITRAAKQNNHERRKLRFGRRFQEELPEEKDIKVREKREFNKKLMEMIWEAVETPTMQKTVELYFFEADLPIPSNVDGKRSSLISMASVPRLSVADTTLSYFSTSEVSMNR